MATLDDIPAVGYRVLKAVKMSRACSEGWGDFVTDNVERITGHAPGDVEKFIREVLTPALA